MEPNDDDDLGPPRLGRGNADWPRLGSHGVKPPKDILLDSFGNGNGPEVTVDMGWRGGDEPGVPAISELVASAAGFAMARAVSAGFFGGLVADYITHRVKRIG